MKVNTFEIVLDNPNRVYYVGEKISGRINISVDSDKTVRGIILILKGKAEVKWADINQRTNTTAPGTNFPSISYGNYEKYFENKVTVSFGGGDNHVLQARKKYVFPFSCPIPSNIPSSFESEFGYVRYTAKAVIDRPWKLNRTIKVPFTVKNHPLNLNAYPNLSKPIILSKVKTFGHLCWASGQLSATLFLQARGFVPGQNLLANIQIENNSRLLKYHSPSETKTVQYKISEKYLGTLHAHTKKNWNQVALSIPTVARLDLINLNHCTIIDIIYRARLVIIPVGSHKEINLCIPIVLGMTQTHQIQPIGSYYNPLDSTTQELPLVFSDTPPPSYEESVGTKNEI